MHWPTLHWLLCCRYVTHCTVAHVPVILRQLYIWLLYFLKSSCSCYFTVVSLLSWQGCHCLKAVEYVRRLRMRQYVSHVMYAAAAASLSAVRNHCTAAQTAHLHQSYAEPKHLLCLLLCILLVLSHYNRGVRLRLTLKTRQMTRM
jgi:hypothetical protein